MTQRPSESARFIERERVCARLETVFAASAGEVTGPAGSGKTTALRTWAGRTTVGDVAWLTADTSHRDSTVLARAVADSVQRVTPLDAPPANADPAVIIAGVASAVDQSASRVAIVIDNAEVLAGAQSLGVIQRLTASQHRYLRVVVAGRSIPDVGFEEFRRRGEMVSVDAGDLRLLAHETASIVRAVSRLDLGEESVAAIDEQVEGWAMGAVLTGLALRGSGDPVAAATGGLGSHRYFEDYLGVEVLDKLPDDVGTFLLETSVLDRLEPALCTELTGRRDAERVLRDLEGSGVFTEWLGGTPPGYRYHALVRSWLRAHLQRSQPDRAVELVRSAASWCERQGQLAEAIEYRIAGHDPTAATELLTEYGPRALGEGRYEAIRTWIRALPTDVVTSSFPLLILLADAEHRLGNVTGARAAWALTKGLRTEGSDLELAGYHHELSTVVRRGTELSRGGRALAALAQARRAEEIAELASPPAGIDGVQFGDVVLALSVASMAGQFMMAGRWPECVRWSRWVTESFPAGDPDLAQARASCLGQLAIAEVVQGSRFAAEDLAEQAVALCRFHGLDPIDLGYAEIALVVVGREADRPMHHASLERRARQLDLPSLTCLVALMRAWSYVQTGDVAAAGTQLAVAEQAFTQLPEPGVLTSLRQRVTTIVEAGTDEPLLRPRELEVLSGLATGASRREVAGQLHLSTNTVKTYARLAYRALGVSTLDAALARCAALGISLAAPEGTPTSARADAGHGDPSRGGQGRRTGRE